MVGDDRAGARAYLPGYKSVDQGSKLCRPPVQTFPSHLLHAHIYKYGLQYKEPANLGFFRINNLASYRSLQFQKQLFCKLGSTWILGPKKISGFAIAPAPSGKTGGGVGCHPASFIYAPVPPAGPEADHP